MGHFALITEGYTDQIILKCILLGIFEEFVDVGDDPVINFELPPTDETSRNGEHPSGGWTLLMKYFEAGRYKQALQTNKYLIVHIDADRCEEYGVTRHAEGKLRTPELLIEAIIEKFKSLIEPEIYEVHKERFIFAIALDEIECWLLPLVFPKNQTSKTSKTTGCLEALNYHLNYKQRELPLTDAKNNANIEVYRRLARLYMKRKKLMECCSANVSLEVFVSKLTKLVEENSVQFSTEEVFSIASSSTIRG